MSDVAFVVFAVALGILLAAALLALIGSVALAVRAHQHSARDREHRRLARRDLDQLETWLDTSTLTWPARTNGDPFHKEDEIT